MAWTDMTDLTGLVAWYKPETLAASYANGDPIDTWADSSGNSRDLTGTTTTRPLAAASAFGTHMAASFDGTDDILSSGSYAVSGKTYASIVFNNPSDRNYNGLICIDGNSTPAHVCDFLTCYAYSNGDWLIGRGAPSSSYNTYIGGKPGVPSPATDTIVSTSASVDGFLLRANGTTTYAASAGGSFATHTGTGYIHIGNVGSFGSTTMNGDVAEIVIWEDTADTAIPWVEGYLADKYSITLADGHLFKNEPPQNAPTTYNTGTGATNVAAAKFTRLE